MIVEKFDLNTGDLLYFAKKMKCECCKKTKRRWEFSQAHTKDDVVRFRCVKVCAKCREVAKPDKDAKLSWNGRGEKADDVTRPSIIDLMEERLERD